MTRAPWRSGDITDAIQSVSTRPSLPVVAHALGLDQNVDVEALTLTRCDEVYAIVIPTDDYSRASVAFWCMDLGQPWVQ